MPNLIHSTEHALPSMCPGQAKVYLDRTVPDLFGRALPHAKLWTMAENERYYDVYQVVDPETRRRERFYFDVSGFFGRALEFAGEPWQDLPEPNRSYPLSAFISREDVLSISVPDRGGVRYGIDDYSVTFKQYSSEQIGNRIATLSLADRSMNVTPVRSYVNRDIPFLHGYRFYRLFMFHQIVHWHQDHDVTSTELGPRRDGRIAAPGVECIAHNTLAPYDFAREFLNFTLTTHQVDAFEDRAELDAFAETARFGIRTDVFGWRDLRLALSEAGLPGRLKNRLRNAIGLDAPRPDPLAISEHAPQH